MEKVKLRPDHLKFSISSVSIQNIRYADDTVLLAWSNLIYILKEEHEIRGLKIKRERRKLMAFSKNKMLPKFKLMTKKQQ